jgi:hypothetical protein
MLDLSRDPSAAGVLDPEREVGGEVPFCPELDLAEFARSSLRNCSLFMVAVVDVRCLFELSLGARGCAQWHRESCDWKGREGNRKSGSV